MAAVHLFSQKINTLHVLFSKIILKSRDTPRSYSLQTIYIVNKKPLFLEVFL
jgi:hypothetical protein